MRKVKMSHQGNQGSSNQGSPNEGFPAEALTMDSLEKMSKGDVPIAVLRQVLLQLDNDEKDFVHSPELRLKLMDLLSSGNLDVLETLIEHLDLLSFRDVADEERERYLAAVDDKIKRLARPFAYQDPEELALNVSKELSQKDIGFDEKVSTELLWRTKDLCEMISCKTLRSLTCRAGDMSATSSRKSEPPSARLKRPGLSFFASVKAPFL